MSSNTKWVVGVIVVIVVIAVLYFAFRAPTTEMAPAAGGRRHDRRHRYHHHHAIGGGRFPANPAGGRPRGKGRCGPTPRHIDPRHIDPLTHQALSAKLAGHGDVGAAHAHGL